MHLSGRGPAGCSTPFMSFRSPQLRCYSAKLVRRPQSWSWCGFVKVACGGFIAAVSINEVGMTSFLPPSLRTHSHISNTMKLGYSLPPLLSLLLLSPLASQNRLVEGSLFGHRNHPSSLTTRERSYCGTHHMPCPAAEPCCNSKAFTKMERVGCYDDTTPGWADEQMPPA
jgi:hypothetical protein